MLEEAQEGSLVQVRVAERAMLQSAKTIVEVAGNALYLRCNKINSLQLRAIG